MDKKKGLLIVIAVAIVLVGILYLFRSKTVSNSSMANETSTTSSSNPNGSGQTTVGMKSTLGGIFDEPGSYQCDYEQVSGSSRSTNVVYISNGKLRGEFRTRSSTATTASLMVYDGVNLYVWTEGQSTGKVSQPKTIKDLPSVIPEDITSGKILGSSANNVSWNCHAWSKDATKLVKPSYVTFK